jgi:hypothetical protein
MYPILSADLLEKPTGIDGEMERMEGLRMQGICYEI